MLGLKKGIVKLVPHEEEWHQLFADEKARLQDVVGEIILAIEHIGSTSICGISAKPVLDIAVAIEKYSDGDKCVAPLEDLGYEYRGAHGIAERRYFVRGAPRTHHLHMLEVKSDAWRGHLLFRDCLRRNSMIAAEYDNLKKNLALTYAKDRVAYLAGKTEFIENVLLRAAKFEKL